MKKEYAWIVGMILALNGKTIYANIVGLVLLVVYLIFYYVESS